MQQLYVYAMLITLRWIHCCFLCFLLTLVNVQEGLAKLAGQQRLGQIPEELLHHVGHVVRRLILVSH